MWGDVHGEQGDLQGRANWEELLPCLLRGRSGCRGQGRLNCFSQVFWVWCWEVRLVFLMGCLSRSVVLANTVVHSALRVPPAVKWVDPGKEGKQGDPAKAALWVGLPDFLALGTEKRVWGFSSFGCSWEAG